MLGPERLGILARALYFEMKVILEEGRKPVDHLKDPRGTKRIFTQVSEHEVIDKIAEALRELEVIELKLKISSLQQMSVKALNEDSSEQIGKMFEGFGRLDLLVNRTCERPSEVEPPPRWIDRSGRLTEAQ